MKPLALILLALILAGCATTTTSTPPRTVDALMALQLREHTGAVDDDWDVPGDSQAGVLVRLEAWAMQRGVVVAIAPIGMKHLLGVTQRWDLAGWVVLINRNLSPNGQLATLLHELAHVFGRHGVSDEEAEVIAELTAAQACERLGLNIWPQSTTYLWQHARLTVQTAVAWRYGARVDTLVDMLVAAGRPQ